MQYAFKLSALTPEVRAAVERLIGRRLRSDEAVELVIHKLDEPRGEPEIARRKPAASRIRELARGKSIGGTTPRQLIHEGRRS